MSSTNDGSINREALIRTIKLVQPALSTLDYIPALKHIRFSDGFASAFNDNQAIQVALPSKDLDLGVCIPGDFLAKTLGSFNAERVVLQPNEKDGSLVISSGRSKVKTKTLPTKDFPLTLPTGKALVIEVTDDMLEGIRRCLLGVGNNPTHAASMGVTLDAEDGKAILYSTDNATISRYQTKTKITLPGDTPVVIPTFFCDQLVSLAKAFPKSAVDLKVYPGALEAEFIDDQQLVAVLFTKTLDDLTALDYGQIIAKHLNVAGAAKRMGPIPSAFDSAFDRALLVLGAVADKATMVSPTEPGLKLKTTSDAGEASDNIDLEGDAWTPENLSEFDELFYIDPSLVIRGCKNCSTMGFFNRVMVFGDQDGRFLHLISHCSASA